MIGTFFFINILFSQASAIAGWDQSSFVMLYLTFALAKDFLVLFMRRSLERFTLLIQTGQLDGYLLKPVSSRFLVSLLTGRLSYDTVPRIVVSLFLLYRYSAPYHPSPISWLGFFAMFVTGLIAVYCSIFILHTLVIWFIRLDNLTHFSVTALEVSRVPLDSWPRLVQHFFVFGFPLALVSTIPVRVLTNQTHLTWFILAPLVAIAFWLISQKFWTFALRYYSSASS